MSSFWINQPYILIDKDKIMDIWPLEKMNRTEKLNAISRLIIILTIIGIILTKSLKIIISGVVTLIIIVILYLLFKKDDILNSEKKSLKEEGFSNYNKMKHNFTNPNITNPNMNLLLPEIQDNPNKVESAESYNKFVTEDINLATKDFIKSQFNDDKIDDKLFNNLGDNYQFEQSMRQFYTTANTKVCNNQGEFARFCYGNMAACKDNNIEECIKNNPRHINM
jgi:hypothetical protein|tara:strand:+ start:2680 stop:3348 length:669 start_codon:yes stop_codon:yes gene_type:complete